MLSRLFPLGVKVSFENRVYKLGETINLTVELSPKRDMDVREGRVELVCEEHWRESSTVMVPVRRATSGHVGPGTGVGGGYVSPPMVPKQVTEEHRETYVHSSLVFLKDAQLRSGATMKYSPTLAIQPEPPPHADKATLAWRLITTTDVAGARDIKARRLVKVTQG